MDMEFLFQQRKPGSQSQDRVNPFCLGLLCLKIQIPKTKLQTNLKNQCSTARTFQDEALFGFSIFGH